jgi:hypothetical protein
VRICQDIPSPAHRIFQDVQRLAAPPGDESPAPAHMDHLSCLHMVREVFTCSREPTRLRVGRQDGGHGGRRWTFSMPVAKSIADRACAQRSGLVLNPDHLSQHGLVLAPIHPKDAHHVHRKSRFPREVSGLSWWICSRRCPPDIHRALGDVHHQEPLHVATTTHAQHLVVVLVAGSAGSLWDLRARPGVATFSPHVVPGKKEGDAPASVRRNEIRQIRQTSQPTEIQADWVPNLRSGSPCRISPRSGRHNRSSGEPMT